jgi:hypothetical protein
VVVETREEIRAADIRQEADADLRHGRLVAFAGHAMGSVERDADAAAEQKAVDERHVRPDEFLQLPGMGVGGAIEGANGVERALLDPLVQGLEIASAAEHGGMGRLHHHAIDVRIRRPAPVLLAQRVEHFAAQRV